MHADRGQGACPSAGLRSPDPQGGTRGLASAIKEGILDSAGDVWSSWDSGRPSMSPLHRNGCAPTDRQWLRSGYRQSFHARPPSLASSSHGPPSHLGPMALARSQLCPLSPFERFTHEWLFRPQAGGARFFDAAGWMEWFSSSFYELLLSATGS